MWLVCFGRSELCRSISMVIAMISSTSLLIGISSLVPTLWGMRFLGGGELGWRRWSTSPAIRMRSLTRGSTASRRRNGHCCSVRSRYSPGGSSSLSTIGSRQNWSGTSACTVLVSGCARRCGRPRASSRATPARPPRNPSCSGVPSLMLGAAASRPHRYCGGSENPCVPVARRERSARGWRVPVAGGVGGRQGFCRRHWLGHCGLPRHNVHLCGSGCSGSASVIGSHRGLHAHSVSTVAERDASVRSIRGTARSRCCCHGLPENLAGAFGRVVDAGDRWPDVCHADDCPAERSPHPASNRVAVVSYRS